MVIKSMKYVNKAVVHSTDHITHASIIVGVIQWDLLHHGYNQ